MRFIPAVSPVQIQVPLPCSTGCESIPCLIWPVGQVVKTRPFHGCNMGSSPVRVTTSAIRKRDCRIIGGLAQLVRAPASHAGGHWFESSSLHQTLEIAMISRVFSCYQKMIVFCFTVLSLYFLSKLIVFYRNEKETLSRLFFHYLSCTFLPLMWSMLMRNIWTALPEAATSSSTIFSVG